jgi:hypothetical protein
MATINYTTEVDLKTGYVKVEWSGLAANDDGQPFDCAGLKLVSAHYFGNFSGGNAKITLMASNELSPSNFSEFLYSFSPRFYPGQGEAPIDAMAGAIMPVANVNLTSGSVALLFVPRD